MGSVEHIERVTDLRVWLGDIPVSHLYTMGVAGERFFREIKENGRFLGARCEACAYTYLPPSLFCPRCFAKLDDWREVGPAGTVRARTLVHVDLDGRRLEEPIAVGLVQLDGADGVFVHRLAEGVEVGQRVTAAFKEPRQRTGSILDIEQFRPL
ncbi:MAG TPA: Zn-ribbon domain-containing OB-fold protein [Dehalococcoidia bacterium]|nr:Zn-ribbon domain-containing OB-fold protein [Dehalococcoidia bacterium]